MITNADKKIVRIPQYSYPDAPGCGRGFDCRSYHDSLTINLTALSTAINHILHIVKYFAEDVACAS